MKKKDSNEQNFDDLLEFLKKEMIPMISNKKS